MRAQHSFALEQVRHCFEEWQGRAPDVILPLNTSSGSNRQYFQLITKGRNYIGTYNEVVKENEAFFYFSNFFRQQQIRVPEVYYISPNGYAYLQQDVGQVPLMQILKTEGETTQVFDYYKQSLDMLWQMQSSIEGINFEGAYPRPVFDQCAILWDLNYFKYYFLKLQAVHFDENVLENDFCALATSIEQLSSNRFFMFRDFQARNIHIYQGKPWFIDFQGGRQGPPLYDLVSLLYQSSAQLSKSWRTSLKMYYKILVLNKLQYDEHDFEHDFLLMRLIRSLQTLGAYGFRGRLEQKSYFIESIPPALANLQKLIQNEYLDKKFPYLCHLLAQIKAD